jgi:hypothetical protein
MRLRMRGEGHVTRIGKERNGYRLLVGNPEEKRPLGRPRRMWVNNIKMDLREIGYFELDRSGSGWEPVEASCEHSNELLNFINCLEVLVWLHNLRLLKEGSAP